MNQQNQYKKQRSIGIAVAAGAIYSLLLAGCGKGVNTVQASEVTRITQDAIVDVLLGTPPEAVRQAPPDKPLLTPGGYNRVIIAADERGFSAVSKGAWSDADVRTLEDRVVKEVDKRISRKNDFHAASTTFPAPAPPPATGEPNRLLLATLTPATQIAGSPDDIANNRAKTLLLVRLTVSDAQSGVVLVIRDYYSGRDVRR